MIRGQKFLHHYIAVAALVIAALPIGCANVGPTYKGKDVIVREIRLLNDGDVRICFLARAKPGYFCPGAVSEVDDDRVELVFLRCRLTEKALPAIPAASVKRGRETVQVIHVPAKGKPVYLRDGNRLILLTENGSR